MTIELGKELLQLGGGTGLTSAEVAGAKGLYVVDADGNSRFVSFANLKTAINTSPTVVPSSVPHRGARVVRTGTLVVPDTNENAISWQSADFNTDSIWSSGAPTRLIVPVGVTKVSLTGGVRSTASSATNNYAVIRKNGTTYFASSGMSTGFSNGSVGLATGVIAVSAGDYFELLYAFNSITGSRTIVNEPRTFFSMNVVEASI
ncbi:hypothetical protein M2281_005773 [Mesorhizobium soli]|uniref:hypothetical protein n=1 Tax=Pseudaminobacter soli (ex Li et al. 2025) TaxID=1295366 RepID=UPI0024740601|nr:hypothetical protein [Mesorhizobium soli]MDH6235151.1 hypothetical protein [Mesorhizobium soli]